MKMPNPTAYSAWKTPTNPLVLIASRAFWLHWPWGLSSCASGAGPSTCLWATSGCMCVRWSRGAWQPPRAAGMWRCSSSLAHMSGASWPVAHPACRTGPGAPRPAGQSPWKRECEEPSFSHLGDLADESGDPLAKPKKVGSEWPMVHSFIQPTSIKQLYVPDTVFRTKGVKSNKAWPLHSRPSIQGVGMRMADQ